MKKRRQRCALSAKGHVIVSKLTYDLHAETGTQICRLSDLKCRRRFRMRAMKNGLPVQTDIIAFYKRRLVGIKAAQVMMKLGNGVTGKLILRSSHKRRFKNVGISHAPKFFKGDFIFSDSAKGIVHTVKTGP